MAEKVVVIGLPAGWASVAVGDSCVVNPRTFLEPVESHCSVSFIPMAAVEAKTGRIDLSQVRTYGEVSKGYTRFSEGDVLFAKITPCMENGKIAIAKGLTNGCGCGSTEFHVLRIRSGLSQEFLYFFLLQDEFRKGAQRNMAGTAGQLRVPAAWLSEASIPLPPLAEQARIVAEIETQFTRLDASVAALRRAQANLKRYRASVLKDACEGRLVPTEAELARSEGREYEPADVLLERILAERRARWESQEKRRGKYKEPSAPDTSDLPELPEGWAWATVDQLGALGAQPVLTGPFGTTLKSADFTSAGTPVLTIGCLTVNGINLEKAVFISSEKASELSRYRLEEGDVLFSRMATVGRAGMIGAEHSGALFNYHIMRLRLNDLAVVPQYYMAYVRGSSEVERYLTEINHGATRDGINTSQLLTMPFALPPFAEQRRIVAEVERRLSVVQQAEATVEASLARAERLRQSILKQAFSGRLVPQDPDDEPASVLLERIRAEREAEAQTSAAGKGKAPRRAKRKATA